MPKASLTWNRGYWTKAQANWFWGEWSRVYLSKKLATPRSNMKQQFWWSTGALRRRNQPESSPTCTAKTEREQYRFCQPSNMNRYLTKIKITAALNSLRMLQKRTKYGIAFLILGSPRSPPTETASTTGWKSVNTRNRSPSTFPRRILRGAAQWPRSPNQKST